MLFVLTRSLKTAVVLLTFASVVVAQRPLPAKQKQDVALWKTLQPRIEAELARHQMVCDPASNWKVRVADVVDLTGDGVPEAVVNWCNGGAYTDSLILMRLEKGRPVLARSRIADGNYSFIELAYGSSAMHSVSYEFHPERHAIYLIQYEFKGFDQNNRAFGQAADVDVCVWNPKTKTFNLNKKLSKLESEARSDEKPKLATAQRKPPWKSNLCRGKEVGSCGILVTFNPPIRGALLIPNEVTVDVPLELGQANNVIVSSYPLGTGLGDVPSEGFVRMYRFQKVGKYARFRGEIKKCTDQGSVEVDVYFKGFEHYPIRPYGLAVDCRQVVDSKPAH